MYKYPLFVTPNVSSLVCCSSWGPKEQDTAQLLNNVSENARACHQGALVFCAVASVCHSVSLLNSGILQVIEVVVLPAQRGLTRRVSVKTSHCFRTQPTSGNPLDPSVQPRPQNIKKQRHYFVYKCPSSQGYGFSSSDVCESWTIKKAESQRIDASELWFWRRLLRVPWTARRSNLSIIKEINPGYSLERLMLKLKLQYFGHLMQRTDSFEQTLILGKIEGGRRG